MTLCPQTIQTRPIPQHKSLSTGNNPPISYIQYVLFYHLCLVSVSPDLARSGGLYIVQLIGVLFIYNSYLPTYPNQTKPSQAPTYDTHAPPPQKNPPSLNPLFSSNPPFAPQPKNPTQRNITSRAPTDMNKYLHELAS